MTNEEIKALAKVITSKFHHWCELAADGIDEDDPTYIIARNLIKVLNETHLIVPRAKVEEYYRNAEKIYEGVRPWDGPEWFAAGKTEAIDDLFPSMFNQNDKDK